MVGVGEGRRVIKAFNGHDYFKVREVVETEGSRLEILRPHQMKTHTRRHAGEQRNAGWVPRENCCCFLIQLEGQVRSLQSVTRQGSSPVGKHSLASQWVLLLNPQ